RAGSRSPAGRPLRRSRRRGGHRPARLAGARGSPDAARLRARSRQSHARAQRHRLRPQPARFSGLDDAIPLPGVCSCRMRSYPEATPPMRHRWFILVAVVLLALIGGAVAAYAYDSARDDTIAKGVTVAGVDVGGMTTAQAQRVVRRELQKPLEQPITVRRGQTRFTLSAQDAGVKADVGGMVDEALAASREGTIITRVARDITGGEEDAQV